jgi:glycine dehydrogenase subunit 1
VSYVPHTPEEIARMLESIGVGSLGQLFDSVPAALREGVELKLPPALAERALLRHFEERAAANAPATRVASFLGAGAYAHFIPSAVGALASRGEFATAYTPYQAEISQGTLQAIFEFQTLICQLTGLDVANASLYDGASATAEAALMALRVTRRRRLCVSAGLHPRYLDVLRTYTRGLGAEVELLPLDAEGRTRVGALPADCAALVVQSPSFYGPIEDGAALAARAHEAGALAVAVIAEPLCLALLKPPGELGADIACGEAQSFGLPLSFGGPYAGFLAARQALVRQLPGRLIGETVDAAGQRAFVMTLTTREQHIRRERATSNICTNQGLCALRVCIYLALLGRAGLRRLAQINLSLSRYAQRALREAGLRSVYAAPVFNEFTVEVPRLDAALARCQEQGIRPGVPLRAFDPGRADQLLVCTTELNSRAQIDALARALSA